VLGKFRYVIVLCGVVALFLTVPVLRAQTSGADCGSLVVNHSYANTFSGFMNTGEYLGFNLGDQGQWGLVPNAGAGIVTFLPGGVVKNTETIVVGQFAVQQDAGLTGTYNLKWDMSKTPALCAGPVHMIVNGTGTNGIPAVADDFQVTVTPDGQRVEMIHTNAGLIVDTTAEPAGTAGCRNNTIDGKYTYTTRGWGLGALMGMDDSVPAQSAQMLAGYLPAAMSGAMQFSSHVAAPDGFEGVFAGASAVSGWDTLSINGGPPVYRKMIGWYKVNRDCTGTLVLRDDSGVDPDFQIELFVGKGGDSVYGVNMNTISMGGPAVPVFVMPIPLERTIVQNQR
jgi:hypothetical protein